MGHPRLVLGGVSSVPVAVSSECAAPVRMAQRASEPMAARHLTSATAHVWSWPLAASPACLADLQPLLDATELAQAQRRRFPHLRDRYVVAHGLLRLVLGAYADTSPRALVFLAGRHGKPAIAGDAPLRFNLSHSGDRALLALTLGSDVGVDIERIDPLIEIGALVHPWLLPEERRRIEERGDDSRRRASFEAWTRVEARGKARGTGLTGLSANPADRDDALAVWDLSLADDYAGAVAVDRSVDIVMWWEFPSAEAATAHFVTSQDAVSR